MPPQTDQPSDSHQPTRASRRICLVRHPHDLASPTVAWVDLAALASRLGTTPSTTAAPLYSYLCDLVSSVQTPAPQAGPAALVDEADLKALLARFGGHP